MRTSDVLTIAEERRSAKRHLVAALALLVLAASLMPGAFVAPAAADEAALGSAVTLTNRDHAINPDGAPFPDLEVTISQTKDLLSQGIQISYKGGQLSTPPASTIGGEHFLQVAQCWGEDPENPGHPDRRTCQYGGTGGWGATRDGGVQPDSIHPQDADYSAPGQWSSTTTIPFVAHNAENIVDHTKAPADRVLVNTTRTSSGDVVMKPESEWVNLSTNRFYNATTTNEVNWAPFANDGTGSIPFELQTATQSPALGCGTPVSDTEGTPCWLVVIPRGSSDNGSININTPGLWWDSWEHHLAVKLEFKPVGNRCDIGANERPLAGSELASGAIASWQPVLCKGESGAPFTLTQIAEADALLAASGTATSALALTSRPLDLDAVGWEADPLVYAPVALGGLAVSFAIDSQPNPLTASDVYKLRSRLPLTDMKLTPRLVAKLLTASYFNSVPSGADASHLEDNPRTIVWDPDFLEINDPEWAVQTIIDSSIADALVPIGRSDLAVRLWEYVLADPEAKAWLDGEPDPWGMTVNPWYSTNPDLNPSGAPLGLPTDSFPKADPVEKPDTTVEQPFNGTGAINLVTWRPYTASFSDGGYRVLRGDGMVLGDWNGLARPPKFDSAQRLRPGFRKVLAVTTTPAAQRYQTVTAALRNAAGEFVSPTDVSLTAAAEAMVPTSEGSQVVAFDHASEEAKKAAGAYPLAIPVYAALNPGQPDEAMRAAYADLIEYAVGEGQTPGNEDGNLPPGYAPLPTEWRTQALAAAEAIALGGWPVPEPTPSPTPTASPSASPSPTASASPAAANQPTPSATPAATTPASAPPPYAPANPGLPQPGFPAPGPLPVDQQPPPPADPGEAVEVPGDPIAIGNPAGALQGAPTPADPPILGPLGTIVPATGLVGLAAALGVPAITRLRRLS